jgi:ATPase subunit of ABC transporter with duplicated ATPase domains
VLAVAHDRYFVERFATTVWHIADGDLQVEIRQTAQGYRPKM